MKKIYLHLFSLGLLISCHPSTQEPIIVKAPIDSLIINWCNSWNNHDSAGVLHLFQKDALLIDDNLIANHADEISNTWIRPNIRLINNLKTTKLQDWSTGERAGYTGKYELNVVIHDTIVAHPNGVFTVNWLKNDWGEWKITNASIHHFPDPK